MHDRLRVRERALDHLLCAWLLATPACTNDASQAPERVPYADVRRILTQSCAKDVCHGFMTANARLDLTQGDPRAALVGVPSCEYDRMMRVAPGDAEHSWIMVKLRGPVRFRGFTDFIDFTPDPDWHASTPACAGQFDDGSPWFGTRMPPAGTTEISPSEIDAIAAWIRSGAGAD
jgi:hypothetical protein